MDSRLRSEQLLEQAYPELCYAQYGINVCSNATQRPFYIVSGYGGQFGRTRFLKSFKNEQSASQGRGV